MTDYMDFNEEYWDKLVATHVRSDYYDVDSFKQGETSLLNVELEEIGGEVVGKRLLHLQCHFGMDTLSWARMGADVTGVDFSGTAVEKARKLSQELGIKSKFVKANVLNLRESLRERFDIVFTSYGVIGWLPRLDQWAQVIADSLEPGGWFYMVEIHPLSLTLEADPNPNAPLKVSNNYFQDLPDLWVDDLTYTGDQTQHKTPRRFNWTHSLSDVINSLIGSGLELDYLHEFPFAIHEAIPALSKSNDGFYRVQGKNKKFPFLFSLRAKKP